MTRPSKSRAFLLCCVPCVLGLLAASRAAEAAERKPVWLAVVRPDLAEPLKPLAELRRRDGFDVRVSTKSVGEALKEVSQPPDFLLLVGDDEPGKENASWYLPAKRMKLYLWESGQRQVYASDSVWGGLDKEGVPRISVGRIPARSPAEVALVVRKIVAYESQPPKASDLSMPVWLGSPEYTPTIDTFASTLGKSMVETKGPPWLRPWFVCGNPNDALCGWPPHQPSRFARQMHQGGIFCAMMGHGSPEAFFSMRFGGKQVCYTTEDARAELKQGPPAPPLVIFACEAGDFTQATPCLAKSLLFLPGGPVATIAATTESHPLANYFSAVCLLTALGGQESRLGTLWLGSQRKARRLHDFLIEMVLKDVEGSLETEIDQEKMRRDQALMYALLGDPATRLRLPLPLTATVQRTAQGWHWRAKKPPGATSLEVGFREPRFAPQLPKGKSPDAASTDKAADVANAGFAFTPQPSPPRDGPWEGSCDRAGWLRLVATGQKTLYVAVLKME